MITISENDLTDLLTEVAEKTIRFCDQTFQSHEASDWALAGLVSETIRKAKLHHG